MRCLITFLIRFYFVVVLFHWLLLQFFHWFFFLSFFQFICMFFNQFWCIQWCRLWWQIIKWICVSVQMRCLTTVLTNMSRNTSLSQLFNEFSAFIVTFNIMIIVNRYQNIHTINTLSMPCSAMLSKLNTISICVCVKISWLLLDEVRAFVVFLTKESSYRTKTDCVK